jgi:hypothetical protein
MPTGIGNGLAPQTFGQPLSNNSICPAEYCYEFDGATESGVQLSGLSLGASNFSISIWFKTADVTGGAGIQTLFGTFNFANAIGWKLYLTATGKLAFESTGAPGWTDTFASFTPTNDTWHHVVYSVDRGGNAVWYGDVTTTQSTDLSANATNLDTAGNFGELAGGFSGLLKYTGMIADLAVWSIPLSVDQVTEYNTNSRGVDKLCADTALHTWPSLLAWWRFTNPLGIYENPMPTTGNGLALSGVPNGGFILSNMTQANVITDYPA